MACQMGWCRRSAALAGFCLFVGIALAAQAASGTGGNGSGKAPDTGLAGAGGAAAPAASPPSDQEKELNANLEKARRALCYGIDSVVTSVINQAKTNKDKRLAPEIAVALDSLNAEVQGAALDYFIALQEYSAHARVVAMLDGFNDLATEVSVRLLKFLQTEKLPADAALIEKLLVMSQASKAEIQAAAIDTLSACGSVDQMPELIKLFKKSGTPTVARAAILRAMGKYPTAETSKLLKDVVGDPGEEKALRYEAISALGRQGQADNLGSIKSSLTAADVFERGAAISALAGFDAQTVLPLYRQALRDGLWRNRVGVLKVIAEKKLSSLEEAVSFVAEEDPEKPVRIEALRTLAVIDGQSGWTMMKRLFANPKSGDEIRGQIAELLINKHFAGSQDVLVQVFDEEFAKEKSWLLDVICRELAGIKEPAAVGFLDRMLGHKNFIIQIYGVRGIKENDLAGHRAKFEEMLKAKPQAALKSSLEDALK